MGKLPMLIIGGGMSGITAAVEATEAGLPVVLVEKLPYLGGNAIAMGRYFPKMCPPYCGMEINFRRIKDNPLITYYVSTQVKEINQLDTGFNIQLESEPELVNNNCTLCGDCSAVCPAEQPDAFNQHMSAQKAIHHPHDMAFPERYYLDQSFCDITHCNKCMEVCKYDAIDLKASTTERALVVSSVVLATGWQSMNPVDLPEYSYGKHPDILTNMMMERMSAPNGPTNGKIKCLINNSDPKKIAFVQCAGSRDEKHLPYCSGVCCSASLKQALYAVDTLPDIEVTIHYIDLRVTGRNEDFLRKAENHSRIHLIKGKVTKVEPLPEESGLELISEHIASERKVKSTANMVVLAIGIIPDESPVYDILPGNRSYLDLYSLPDGVVMAGCALQPMDVSASTKSATGAALTGVQTTAQQTSS